MSFPLTASPLSSSPLSSSPFVLSYSPVPVRARLLKSLALVQNSTGAPVRAVNLRADAARTPLSWAPNVSANSKRLQHRSPATPWGIAARAVSRAMRNSKDFRNRIPKRVPPLGRTFHPRVVDVAPEYTLASLKNLRSCRVGRAGPSYSRRLRFNAGSPRRVPHLFDTPAFREMLFEPTYGSIPIVSRADQDATTRFRDAVADFDKFSHMRNMQVWQDVAWALSGPVLSAFTKVMTNTTYARQIVGSHPYIAGGAAAVTGMWLLPKAIRAYRDRVNATGYPLLQYRPSDALRWLSPDTCHQLEAAGVNPAMAALLLYCVVKTLLSGDEGDLVVINTLAMECFSIAGVVVYNFVKLLFDYLQRRYGCKTHGPEDDEKETGMLSAIADYIGQLFNVKDAKSLSDLAAQFNNVSRASTTASGFLAGALEYFPTWARVAIAKTLPTKLAWTYMIQDLNPQGFLEDCRRLLSDQAFALSYTDHGVAEQLDGLFTTATEIARRLVGYNPDGPFAAEFNRHYTRLQAWKHAHFFKMTDIRPAPFSVMFTGGAGVGKSSAVSRLCSTFNFSSWTYKSKFWDGYGGQDAVVFDDWCGVAPDDEFIQSWLTVSSNVDFYPQFASLSDPSVGKKGTKFTSHYVLASTNNAWALPNNVTDVPAWYRRRIPIRVTVDEVDGHQIRMYTEMDRFRDIPVGEPMGWNRFLEWFAEHAVAHFNNEAHMMQLIRDNPAAYRDPYLLTPLAANAHMDPPERDEQVPILQQLRVPAQPDPAVVGFAPDPVQQPPHPVPDPIVFPDLPVGRLAARVPTDDDLNEIDAWILHLRRARNRVDAINAAPVLAQVPPPPVVPAPISWTPQWLSDAYNGFDQKWRDIADFMRDRVWIPITLGIVAAAYVIYKILLSGRSAHYGPGEPDERKVERRRIPLQPKNAHVAPELTNLAKIRSCMCELRIYYYGKPWVCIGFGSGTNILIPYHYLAPIENGEVEKAHCEVTRTFPSGSTFNFSFTLSEDNTKFLVMKGETHDLASISLMRPGGTGSYTAFPNMESLFDDELPESSETILLAPNPKDDLAVHSQIATTTYGNAVLGVAFYDRVLYQYDVPAFPGWCGRMLIHYDSGSRYKILGMHVCGHDGRDGCALPITKTDIQQLSNGIKMPPEFIFEDPCIPHMNVPPGELLTVQDAPRLHAPTRSSHRPSVIAAKLDPSVKDNSVLQRGDIRVREEVRDRHPMDLVITKKSKPGHTYDDDALAQAKQIVFEMFKPTRKLRVLSTHEAIYGCPGHINSMNFRSSAGYPYSQKYRKRDLFFDSQGSPRIAPFILDAIETREKAALVGQRIPSLWTEFLKDELRLVGKVAEGITRGICGAPVDYTVVFRKYHQDAVEFIEQRHVGASIIGININDYEFNRLIEYVSELPNRYATDISNNDGDFPPQLIDAVCDVLDMMYDDDFSMVRRTLYHEAVYTYHYYDHHVFMDNGSENSGFAGTTITNTLGNLIQDVYDIIQLAPAGVKIDVDYVRKNFRLCRYGDDFIGSYSNEVSEWFSPEKQAENVRKCGRKMTAEDKLSAIGTSKLEDIAILKMYPARSADFPNRWVPHMDKELIEDIPKWIRRGGDPFINTAVNCEAALRFAFWWGKEYYEGLREKYDALLNEISAWHLPSYTYTLNLCKLYYYGFMGIDDQTYSNIVRDITAYCGPCESSPDRAFFYFSESHEDPWYLHKRVYDVPAANIKLELDLLPYEYVIAIVRRTSLGTLPACMVPIFLPLTGAWAILYAKNGFSDDVMEFEPHVCATNSSFKLLPQWRVEGAMAVDNPLMVTELVERVGPSLETAPQLIPDFYRLTQASMARWYSSADLTGNIYRVPSHADAFVPSKTKMANLHVGTTDVQEAPVEEPVALPIIAVPSDPTPDARWDIHNILGRKVVIQSKLWAVDSTSDILSFSLPYSLPVTLQQRQLMTSFQYWRGTMCFQIDVAGTRFHQGSLLALVVFNMNDNDSLVNPHVIISANGVSSSTIRVPFVWYKNMLNIAQLEGYRRFRIRVLAPLRAATSSARNIPITVSGWMEDIELSVPTVRSVTFAATHGNSYTKISNISGSTGVRVDDEVDQTNDISPKIAVSAGQKAGDVDFAETDAPKPSKQKVTTGEQRKADVVVLEPSAKGGKKSSSTKTLSHSRRPPVSGGGGAQDVNNFSVFAATADAGGEGGLDLVGNHLDPPYIQRVSLPNMYNVENIEPVYVARMYPNQLTLTSVSDTGRDFDEMAVSNLVQIPTKMDTFQIATQTTGTELWTCSIEPAPWEKFNLTSGAKRVPWCTAISTLCDYWTGDLVWSFMVHSSGLQAGKILIAACYGSQQPANMTEALGCYTLTYDLANEDKILTVRVPYLHPAPLSYCRKGIMDLRTTTRIGVIRCYLLQELTEPTGVPTVVDISVFFAGARNLQFVGRAAQVPYNYMQYSSTRSIERITDSFELVEASSGVAHAHVLGDNVSTSGAACTALTMMGKAVCITPADVTLPINEINGEVLTTIKDYFKSRTASVCTQLTSTTPSMSYTLSTLLDGVPAGTLLYSYFLRRGGVRLTFHSTTTSLSNRIAIVLFQTIDPSPVEAKAIAAMNFGRELSSPTEPAMYSSRAFCVLLEPEQQSITIEIPQYSGTRTSVVGSNEFRVFIFQENITGTNSVLCYVGASDETRFFHLVDSPTLTLLQYKSVDGKTTYTSKYWK
jgi:hypothetical protein